MPLYITPNNVYKSEIDINYKKYGYELYFDNSWANEYMTSIEAQDIALSFTSDLTKHKIAAWNLLAIMSWNMYSFDELYHMNYDDIDRDLAKALVYRRFSDYVKRLEEL